MTQQADIFQQNYESYLARIAEIDLDSVKDTLGLTQKNDQFLLSFFGCDYIISKDGIKDKSGKTADYMVCVILAKYLILCPDHIHPDTEWTAFRDFRRTSHFLNVNYFASDTERVIASAFSGRRDAVLRVSSKLAGYPSDEEFRYDLVMKFKALPRISLLLLFAEGDEDFEPYGTVLFQRHAEYYLDPESLAMTSAYLVKRLREFCGEHA